MAWDNCNVFLNSVAKGVYYAGDIVTGTVTLVFKNKRQIEQINCRIIGISKAQWTRPMPTMPYIKIYSEKKIVLDLKLDVFDNYKDITVYPCIECINFHFTLPENLPSSFKSSIAKVYYFMQIESKANFRLKTKKIIPFKILDKIDLNHLEEYVTPSFYKILKEFRMSGKLTMCFKTFIGFAPLQRIPFEVTICNEEKAQITKIKVALIQKIAYNILSGYTNEEKMISKSVYKVQTNNIKEVCNFCMNVPEIVPSSVDNVDMSDHMIDVSYILRVGVTFPFHFACYEEIPVTVASVPVIHHDYDFGLQPIWNYSQS